MFSFSPKYEIRGVHPKNLSMAGLRCISVIASLDERSSIRIGSAWLAGGTSYSCPVDARDSSTVLRGAPGVVPLLVCGAGKPSASSRRAILGRDRMNATAKDSHGHSMTGG